MISTMKYIAISILLTFVMHYEAAHAEPYKRQPSCETEKVLKKHLKNYKVKHCKQLEECHEAKERFKRRTKGTRRGYTISIGNQYWHRWRQDEEFEYDFE